MGFKKNMEIIKDLIKNKKYEKAENMLLGLIAQSNNKVVEDENNTYYSFNNYIEVLIFWYMYKPEKKNICPDINYSEIYYYLGFVNIETKNYGKAYVSTKCGQIFYLSDNPLILLPKSLYIFQSSLNKTN